MHTMKQARRMTDLLGEHDVGKGITEAEKRELVPLFELVVGIPWDDERHALSTVAIYGHSPIGIR